jgi:hypothetical protein
VNPAGAICCLPSIDAGGPASHCSIGGADFQNGTSNPLDPSTCCNATLNRVDWSPRFVLGTSFPIGSPSDLTVGDFNGDGWPDLAVSDYSDAGVTELLNDRGTLRFAGGYSVSGTPRALAAADLDDDGFDDLAAGSYEGVANGLLSILLSRGGDGGFIPSTGHAPCSCAAGGVKAGRFGPARTPGILCTTYGPLRLFLAIGDGGLRPVVGLPASGYGPLALGDFNGDGLLDIVQATISGEFRVLFGDATDAFERVENLDYVPNLRNDVVAGDLNGDGQADLAVASDGWVTSVISIGDGGFASPASFGVRGNVTAVAIVDVDGDGSNEILFGVDDGLYQLSSGIAARVVPGIGVGRIAVADLNQDGAPDVALLGTLFGTSGLRVFLNGCPR